MPYSGVKRLRAGWKPRAVKAAPKKAYGARRAYRRVPGLPNPRNDCALVTEAYRSSPTGQTTGLWACNNVYFARTIKLANFPRASVVAQGFQQYRINRVTLRFRPMADTFTPSGGAFAVPELIYVVDTGNALSSLTTTQALRQMGGRCVRFDDKVVDVSFKPSVLIDGSGGQIASQGGDMVRYSPWLSTGNIPSTGTVWTPSIVNHAGIVFNVETSPNIQGPTYIVEILAEIEFRLPLMANPIGGVGEPEVPQVVTDFLPF